MANRTEQPVYFVYGNHGKSPSQIEDYFILTKDLFAATLSVPVIPSETIVPDAINILLEAFDKKFEKEIKGVKQAHPGTVIVCFVTEFLTEGTFNNFLKLLGPQLPVNAKSRLYRTTWLGRVMPILIPAPVRAWILSLFPSVYSAAKRIYYPIFGANPFLVLDRYDDAQYWQKRYDLFISASHSIDFIWCVSEHQVNGYLDVLGEERVRLVQPLPYVAPPSNPARELFESAFDTSFTGTLTPRRKEIMTQLRSTGVKVANADFNFPSSMRKELVKQCKFTLHIKQNEFWPFPSNMRLHYLILQNRPVISEKADVPCFQSQFVHEVETESLVAFCAQMRNELVPTPLSQRYFDESEPLRLTTVRRIREDLAPKGSQVRNAHAQSDRLDPGKPGLL
jgi:hypothetical protein